MSLIFGSLLRHIGSGIGAVLATTGFSELVDATPISSTEEAVQCVAGVGIYLLAQWLSLKNIKAK